MRREKRVTFLGLANLPHNLIMIMKVDRFRLKGRNDSMCSAAAHPESCALLAAQAGENEKTAAGKYGTLCREANVKIAS